MLSLHHKYSSCRIAQWHLFSTSLPFIPYYKISQHQVSIKETYIPVHSTCSTPNQHRNHSVQGVSRRAISQKFGWFITDYFLSFYDLIDSILCDAVNAMWLSITVQIWARPVCYLSDDIGSLIIVLCFCNQLSWHQDFDFQMFNLLSCFVCIKYFIRMDPLPNT